VVLVIREDEARHRDTNHGFADRIVQGTAPGARRAGREPDTGS
jgi:hypothetical protein